MGSSAVVWTEAVLLLAAWALTKWFPLPRLETRTKESNICESTRVIQTRVLNESEPLGGRARARTIRRP